MAGTTMTPAMGGAFTGQLAISGEKVTASSLNSCRVSIAAEGLSSRFGSGQVSDPQEFVHLCLALSRGIDHAIGNNQAPETTINIPSLLKQICQHRSDAPLLAALMVLMISVKNACNIGWFSEKEKEELLTLANELGSSFCSPRDMNVEENHSHDTISTIITRFYPLMKMGHILASLEVKPGYEAHLIDFSISRQTKHSPGENIRLFVAQKDELETSKCIISPQLVNFLLNGKAVERRTNISMDLGPQLPTNVNSMLKYGTNLLQAVGQFEGHYIIVIAYMSVTPAPDTPVLLDYVRPDVASHYPDSDIIEGASRISLNCPISYKRMKTPVKGFSCKHFQCFDFSNFVDINSRRPSWRCPHCNQSVSYTDIRIDQNMAKVLKEVGDSVNDVIISADGSWKVVVETNDNVDQAHTIQKDQQEPNVLDLTNEDHEMANTDTFEVQEVKPSQTNLAPQPVTPNQNTQPELNSSNVVNQNLAAEVDDDFWSGLDLPHIAMPNGQIAGGISQANSMSTPPLTNLSSSALDSLLSNEYVRGVFTPPMAQQPQVSNLQQRPRVGNFPIPNCSYSSSQTAPPRLAPANEWRQLLARSHLNVQNRGNQERPFVPGQHGQFYGQQTGFQGQGRPFVPGQQTGFPGQDRPFSPGQQTGFPGQDRPFSPGQQTGFPGQDRPFSPGQQTGFPGQDRPFSSGQQTGFPGQDRPFSPGQQTGYPGQLHGAHRPNPSLLTDFQNPHLQQAFNPTMPLQFSHQSPNPVRPSTHIPPLQFSHQSPNPVHPSAHIPQTHHLHQGVSPSVNAQYTEAIMRTAMQITRQPQTTPVQTHTPRTAPSSTDLFMPPQSVSRTDDLVSTAQDQNWRPTGRMRGSLQGSAYSAALSQFMMQNIPPPAQAMTPPNPTPLPPGFPAQGMH